MCAVSLRVLGGPNVLHARCAGVYLLLDLTPSPCHPCFEYYLSQSSTFIVRFMKTWVAGGCNHRARKRPGHCSGVYSHQFDFTCFLPSSLAKRDKELFTPTVRLFWYTC